MTGQRVSLHACDVSRNFILSQPHIYFLLKPPLLTPSIPVPLCFQLLYQAGLQLHSCLDKARLHTHTSIYYLSPLHCHYAVDMAHARVMVFTYVAAIITADGGGYIDQDIGFLIHLRLKRIYGAAHALKMDYMRDDVHAALQIHAMCSRLSSFPVHHPPI